MGRIIEDEKKSDFPPSIGLLEIGNFVKGEIVASDTTKNGNPVITLKLIDANGTITKGLGDGRYQDVEVGPGDEVNLIGHVTQLREKLPKLQIGDIATITFKSEKKVPKGKMKQFVVEYDREGV